MLIKLTNSGVQGKNNARHNVNKVENSFIDALILNLIDIMVCVVFVLYSRIDIPANLGNAGGVMKISSLLASRGPEDFCQICAVEYTLFWRNLGCPLQNFEMTLNTDRSETQD
jgi:hypothetical protein